MKKKLLLLVLFLTACASKVPPPVSTSRIDPAIAPPNIPAPVTLPPLDASTINIPLNINLDAVRAEVLRHVPSPLVAGSSTQVISMQLGKASATAPVETKISHQVWLRDLNLRMKGNQFVVDVQAEFAISSQINSLLGSVGLASCGINEALPRIQFSLPGTVKWGSQGKLLFSKGQWNLKWLRPCNLTALNISAESILNMPIIRDKVDKLVSDALDSATSNLGVQPQLARYWPELNAPREIQPGLWLMLRPEKVGVADLVGNGNTLNAGVTVQARPYLVTGNKPAMPLPVVPTVDLLPKGEGFHLELRADVSLDEANRMLNQQLAGKPFDANGRTVVIDKLEIYGNGEKAVLGLALKQPIQATIFLLGKPVFDLERNQVFLTDVEYSLSTSSFLAKAAAWMLGSSLREKIQEKARFKFDEDLAGTLQKVRNLKMDLGQGAVARASVERVQPRGLYFTQQDLKALVMVDGKLAVDYGVSNTAAK